ncbi:MAG: hypothetical protein IKZ87_01065 [Actinomycetaceae bacterium]|nr:hypothetical protein [Actinomycetaceae bacterium]
MTENYTPEGNAAQQPIPAGAPAGDNSAQLPQAPNVQPYAPYQAYPQPKQTNGMAIAGLICAFLFTPAGLILSIIGLNKSKELNGEGRGMSIAGIIISAIGIVLGIIYIIAIFWFVANVDTGYDYY